MQRKNHLSIPKHKHRIQIFNYVHFTLSGNLSRDKWHNYLCSGLNNITLDTRAVEISFIIVCFNWLKLITCISGSLYSAVSSLAMSVSFFTLMAMVVILSIPDPLQSLQGDKDRSVILGSGPVQDPHCHDLELDIFFGNDDHVPHHALFQFGRLVVIISIF